MMPSGGSRSASARNAARSTPSATITAKLAAGAAASRPLTDIDTAARQRGDDARRRAARERQAVGRARKDHAQPSIAHQREIGCEHGRLDGAPRHLDLVARVERRVAMDLAQREHREADGPKTEPPNAGLALRNQRGVLERVAQVGVRETDELVETYLERARRMQLLEVLEIEVAARKHRARQPARVRLPVVPDVLEYIGHLQPLTERHGETHHRVT